MNFEKFQEYLWYLVHRPFKGTTEKESDMFKLFKALGKVLDRMKQDIFKLRRQAIISMADSKALEMHGRDRRMPKYADETYEQYRRRLKAKREISEKAGTLEGIKLALKSLGYEGADIEPMYLYDTDRWAEFIIYLSDKHPDAIKGFEIIHKEVMNVKQASSMPAYAFVNHNELRLQTSFKIYHSGGLMCGTFRCGTKPYYANQGVNFKTKLVANTNKTETAQRYKMTGSFKSGEAKL